MYTLVCIMSGKSLFFCEIMDVVLYILGNGLFEILLLFDDVNQYHELI